MRIHFFTAPFLLCFHWVQGSGFKVEVAASPQLYVGDARSRIILAPSSGRGRRAKRGGVGIPVSEIPLREPTSAPSGHPLPKEGGRKVECVDW